MNTDVRSHSPHHFNSNNSESNASNSTDSLIATSPDASSASLVSSESLPKESRIHESQFVALLINNPVILSEDSSNVKARHTASCNIQNVMKRDYSEMVSLTELWKRIEHLKSRVKLKVKSDRKLTHWEDELWKCLCRVNENGSRFRRVILKTKSQSSSDMSSRESSQVKQSNQTQERPPACNGVKITNRTSNNKKTLSGSNTLKLVNIKEFDWDKFVAILKDHLVIFYDGEKPELILARHMAIVEIQERLKSEMSVFMTVNEIWKKFQTLKSDVKLRKKRKKGMSSWESEFWKLYSQVEDENEGVSSNTDYKALVYQSLCDIIVGDKNEVVYGVEINPNENYGSSAKYGPILASSGNGDDLVEPFEFVAVNSVENTNVTKCEEIFSQDSTVEVDCDIPIKRTKIQKPAEKKGEVEETKGLALPELKRLVLLENLKYLRSAQELVNLKIERAHRLNHSSNHNYISKSGV